MVVGSGLPLEVHVRLNEINSSPLTKLGGKSSIITGGEPILASTFSRVGAINTTTPTNRLQFIHERILVFLFAIKQHLMKYGMYYMPFWIVLHVQNLRSLYEQVSLH